MIFPSSLLNPGGRLSLPNHTLPSFLLDRRSNVQVSLGTKTSRSLYRFGCLGPDGVSKLFLVFWNSGFERKDGEKLQTLWMYTYQVMLLYAEFNIHCCMNIKLAIGAGSWKLLSIYLSTLWGLLLNTLSYRGTMCLRATTEQFITSETTYNQLIILMSTMRAMWLNVLVDNWRLVTGALVIAKCSSHIAYCGWFRVRFWRHGAEPREQTCLDSWVEREIVGWWSEVG